MNSHDVREELVKALQLDLIGPEGDSGDAVEVLPYNPSRWYLTGFLVPSGVSESQRRDYDDDEDFDDTETGGGDDAQPPDSTANRSWFPSSMGLSVLIPQATQQLAVTVRWGDYTRLLPQDGCLPWQRSPRQQALVLRMPAETRFQQDYEVSGSGGLWIRIIGRELRSEKLSDLYDEPCRSVSVFLVNRRRSVAGDIGDEAFAFQARMDVQCEQGFVPRVDAHGLNSEDPDLRIADLQFRDCYEFSVGHNVSTTSSVSEGQCFHVRTCWLPQANVERTVVPKLDGVTLSMELLAYVETAEHAHTMLMPFVTSYRSWIEEQRGSLAGLTERRLETAESLLERAGVAADRIESGIIQLQKPDVLEAFRLANQAMGMQARQRLSISQGKSPGEIAPHWRPFQLAFLLMNIRGMVEPDSVDRDIVDLLFFPTGGGKTEAYLGLAAFTLVHRRLKHQGIHSAGVTVLMRYTLRLLTLDQLGRASALICALELIRQENVERLGTWPFEIGLWVGQAATPNVMGKKGDGNEYSARAKTIARKRDDRKPAPIPLENCPWCNEKFRASSFTLVPNPASPTNLRVCCPNRRCEFSAAQENHLPIVSVDEPIYRRLPCFMIATIDKFAALPWTGEVGGFFGRVDRYDHDGFYGVCQPNHGHPIPNGRLPPPELIIQDELHLISGPLGTVAGVYETAIDRLSELNDVRPKIVASTATVRRAESQIRALFNRSMVDIFPPPGPDRRDSFFAQTLIRGEGARRYLGITGQGRSPKRVFLRACLVLMSAAQRLYEQQSVQAQQQDVASAAGNLPGVSTNPADPYMTLLGYFNSLRELGGARRLVEDEVFMALAGYAERKRFNAATSEFANRLSPKEVLELTSRVPTDQVADAKRRLEKPFASDNLEPVDVALATNMISVGLDISRLGLMLIYGQPKTSSEYIQCSSRVGRDSDKPGLVVTILNLNRPRDRSHFERFSVYHDSFYRNVEATSVTPFSPRALDRALAGTVVALARHGTAPMTPPRGASKILSLRESLTWISRLLAQRAGEHNKDLGSRRNDLETQLFDRCQDLLDEWHRIASEFETNASSLQYQREVPSSPRLLHQFLARDLKEKPVRFLKFRANRSMRDVEPEVNVEIRSLPQQ